MNHAPLSWIPKWNVLFELHTMEHLRRVAAHLTNPNDYLDWLAKQPGPDDPKHCPIYMQDHFDTIPASVKLPREELNAWFAQRGAPHVCAPTVPEEGWFAADYYTSTVSFMLALAIMQGRPEIRIYGVDLLQDEEFNYQRAGCEYLIGFARGMGIPVFVPEQSAICKANYTYGFSEPAVESGKLDPLIKYIEDKAGLSDGLVGKARQDAHTFNGAVQVLDLMLTWLASNGADGKDVPTLVKEKKAELEARFKAAEQSMLTLGGQAEAFRTAAVWTKHYARGGALNA